MRNLIVFYLCLIVATIYGWISNIVAVVHSDFTVLTGMLVLRVVGIFVAPLGVILGYF